MENQEMPAQPDEKTITLRKPIKLQDRTVTEITLREPTAGEIEQVEKRAARDGAQASNILLIQVCADITDGEARRLGARDFHEALMFVQGFFPAAPETGDKS